MSYKVQSHYISCILQTQLQLLTKGKLAYFFTHPQILLKFKMVCLYDVHKVITYSLPLAWQLPTAFPKIIGDRQHQKSLIPISPKDLKNLSNKKNSIADRVVPQDHTM